jgi:hypothetical protein
MVIALFFKFLKTFALSGKLRKSMSWGKEEVHSGYILISVRHGRTKIKDGSSKSLSVAPCCRPLALKDGDIVVDSLLLTLADAL